MAIFQKDPAAFELMQSKACVSKSLPRKRHESIAKKTKPAKAKHGVANFAKAFRTIVFGAFHTCE